MTEMEKTIEAIDRGDYATALNISLPLAEQGDVHAQYNLGRMYGDGLGVPQDYAEAVKWFRKAAEQGNAKAQNKLGLMYKEGRGVSRDFVQAYMWLDLAAKKGHEEAKDDRAVVGGKLTKDRIAEAEGLARQWSEKHCE